MFRTDKFRASEVGKFKLSELMRWYKAAVKYSNEENQPRPRQTELDFLPNETDAQRNDRKMQQLFNKR